MSMTVKDADGIERTRRIDGVVGTNRNLAFRAQLRVALEETRSRLSGRESVSLQRSGGSFRCTTSQIAGAVIRSANLAEQGQQHTGSRLNLPLTCNGDLRDDLCGNAVHLGWDMSQARRKNEPHACAETMMACGSSPSRFLWVHFTSPPGSRIPWWTFNLAAPAGQALGVGSYEGARAWGTQATGPRFLFGWDGRSCGSTLAGRFVIDELKVGALGLIERQLDRLHASFQMQCGNAPGGLTGTISIVADPWR